LNIMMVRPSLNDLPPVTLPEGYRLLTAAGLPDLAGRWAGVINAAFGDQDWTPESATRDYINQPQYDPAGVFFIAREAAGAGGALDLVATAFAWLDTPGETELGRVHWVGTCAEHRGRGLANAVVLAVMHYFARHGFARAMLETQSYRAPAISCYQALGFEPYPRNAEEEAEWAIGLANVAALPPR
jgi:ribosomal protein S18 acetylase RimI-like enzyme